MHIRLQVALLAICLTTLSSTAWASRPAGGDFGVGVGSGTLASGVSLKLQQPTLSYQGVIGVARSWGRWGRWNRRCDDDDDGYRYNCRGRGLGLSGDVLLEQPALVQTSGFNLAWNAGGGLGLGIWDDGISVAGAFVLGLEFNFEAVPLDLVLEYRPRLFITEFDLDMVHFTAHLRFYP